MGRRVSLVLDVTFRLGEYREFQVQLQEFLRSPHAKIRGDAALFLAARGRAIWEEAKSKTQALNRPWNPATRSAQHRALRPIPMCWHHLKSSGSVFMSR